MRQAARRMAAGVNDYPLNGNIVDPGATITTRPALTRPMAMSTRMEDDYGHLMSKRANAMASAEGASRFGDAFNIARNAGLTTFRWKGRDFNTQFEEEANIMDRYMPNPKGFVLPNVEYPKPILPETVDVYEEPINEPALPYNANLNNSRAAYVESIMGGKL